MAILTQRQIINTFGDPFPHVLRNGTISARWEAKIIGYVKLPAPLPLSWDRKTKATRLKCHKLLIPHFTQVLGMAFADKVVWKTIDDTGGIYAWRAQRTNSKILSTHAWAISIDLDVKDNAQGRPGKMHPRLIAMFESAGFYWGGRFRGRSRDDQHFQFNDLDML